MTIQRNGAFRLPNLACAICVKFMPVGVAKSPCDGADEGGCDAPLEQGASRRVSYRFAIGKHVTQREIDAHGAVRGLSFACE